MASARYTRNIRPEDLIPDQPVQYTPAQKAANWLHYHKWPLLAALAALAVVLYFLFQTVWAPKPDCRVVVVGSQPLPDELLEDLPACFEGLAVDENDDGRVLVEVEQYLLDCSADGGNMDALSRFAGETQLKTDLEEDWSSIFLVEDPAVLAQWAQTVYWVEGKEPEDFPGTQQPYCWKDSPAAALKLGSYCMLDGQERPGQQLLQDLWLLRRSDVPGGAALWQALTGESA